MDAQGLLKPTLHIEVLLKETTKATVSHQAAQLALHQQVAAWCQEYFVSFQVGQHLSGSGFGSLDLSTLVDDIEVADYTGPPSTSNIYKVGEVELDVHGYTWKPEKEADGLRSIAQSPDNELPQARMQSLPNIVLRDEWASLVFDDGLPARLLRYLVRMVGITEQPALNLSTFNWNRLCLLHGPPGSGKSTLCRGLAQKLSIRLGDVFPKALLVEINTNAMLSKYFGESGKLIGSTFDRVHNLAQDPSTLICVVMDEVETIAGSRERSATGSECGDGLRATNQLLTALDRMRGLSNVIVLCTSNLISAIDRAFLDRVDIKQLIPSPSPAAIYNIFRSCLNELIRSSLVGITSPPPSAPKEPVTRTASTRTSKRKRPSSQVQQPEPSNKAAASSSPEPEERKNLVSSTEVPTFAEMKVRLINEPNSPGRRVWALAQQCQGLSGRTLRRLPILGLAMYTYGGTCTLHDAISALGAAVEQELNAAGGAGREGVGSAEV